MLFAQQPILRRFWYALMPTAHLDDSPKPFTLLGEPLILFKGVDGKPIALQDRCCHHTAKLSKGFVENGNIVCGYHSWTYDATGSCVRIPQNPEGNIPAGAKVKSYHRDDQYGYVWVALEDPLQPIPPSPRTAPATAASSSSTRPGRPARCASWKTPSTPRTSTSYTKPPSA